jgi:hypothetical protein
MSKDEDLKNKIDETNENLRFLGSIIDNAITDKYVVLRKIGQKRAKEAIEEIIKDYNSIQQKLLEGLDDK